MQTTTTTTQFYNWQDYRCAYQVTANAQLLQVVIVHQCAAGQNILINHTSADYLCKLYFQAIAKTLRTLTMQVQRIFRYLLTQRQSE